MNLGMKPIADSMQWTIDLEDWNMEPGYLRRPAIEGVRYLEYESAFMIHNQSPLFVTLFRVLILHVFFMGVLLLLWLLKVCKG